MDWIGEIEKHAGALGRPTIFKDAMTTLSFRLEESLKEDVNLLAEYLTRRLESKSSAGAVARAFIASGLEQMRARYPDFREVSGTAAHPAVTMRTSYRKHSGQKIGNHRRQSRKPEIHVRESDPVPPKRLPPQKSSRPIEGYDLIVSELVDLVESARRFSARSVNAVMTATY